MRKDFLTVMLVATIVAFIVIVGAYFSQNLYAATQVGIGVAVSWVNILFYAIITGAILSKKNIAWVLPVIVIKYLILISAVYFIWASTDVMKVVVGVFSELILTALTLPFVRKARAS